MDGVAPRRRGALPGGPYHTILTRQAHVGGRAHTLEDIAHVVYRPIHLLAALLPSALLPATQSFMSTDSSAPRVLG